MVTMILISLNHLKYRVWQIIKNFPSNFQAYPKMEILPWSKSERITVDNVCNIDKTNCSERCRRRAPIFKVDESQAVIEVLHQGSLEALLLAACFCLSLAACQIVHFDWKLDICHCLCGPWGVHGRNCFRSGLWVAWLGITVGFVGAAGLGRCCVQLSRSGLLRLSRPFPQLHTRQRARPTRRLQTERLFSTIWFPSAAPKVRLPDHLRGDNKNDLLVEKSLITGKLLTRPDCWQRQQCKNWKNLEVRQR